MARGNPARDVFAGGGRLSRTVAAAGERLGFAVIYPSAGCRRCSSGTKSGRCHLANGGGVRFAGFGWRGSRPSLASARNSRCRFRAVLDTVRFPSGPIIGGRNGSNAAWNGSLEARKEAQ
jgi:hypothetical protein